MWSVWLTNSIEPPFGSDEPATIASVVNSESVALGPISVNFSNIVETGWVIIGRLEVLRLEQLVLMSKLVLSHGLFYRSATNTSNLGNIGARITCHDWDHRGWSTSRRSHETTRLSRHRHWLKLLSHVWVRSVGNRWLCHHGLPGKHLLLGHEVLTHWYRGYGRLIRIKVSVSLRACHAK